MPFDLPAEHVLPLLESDDRAWAPDARAAWDSLTAGGDVPVVNLRDLEYFLWYRLPARFLTSHVHHRAVATALGELLSDLGYEDGAALCRGPVTMHVLAEWAKDQSSGYRALRKALDASGVEPPDTDALGWGAVMGMVEASVFETASSILERGLIEREILPVLSEAGWKPSDGRELTPDMVSSRLWDSIRPMGLLGMVEVGAWPDRSLRLTGFGADSARAILWHRATAPRRSSLA